MSDQVTAFNEYRKRMNDNILADNNKVIKRIFNLDTNAFQAGALDVKTKELLGLVASMVLRCDDCVKYHLGTLSRNRNHKTRSYRSFKYCYISRWHYSNSTLASCLRVLGCFRTTKLIDKIQQ